METTFENAQVGDRVWDEYRKEYCIVDVLKENYLIVRYFDGVSFKDFSYLGNSLNSNVRALYWDKLVIPERPKHKVKKVIEGWVNIYPDVIHETESIANINCGHGRLGKAQFIHHEYGAEE